MSSDRFDPQAGKQSVLRASCSPGALCDLGCPPPCLREARGVEATCPTQSLNHRVSECDTCRGLCWTPKPVAVPSCRFRLIPDARAFRWA